jgi:hypothetical protein
MSATRATGSGQRSTGAPYPARNPPRTSAVFTSGDDDVEGRRRAESEFVCECSDPDCTHRVSASLAEYEQVREEPTTFLVLPGHEEDDIERVVSDRGRFRVVDKIQAAVRRTVVRLDPRGPTPSESET